MSPGRLLLLFLLLGLPVSGHAFDFSDYAQLLQRYLVVDQRVNGIAVNLVDYAGLQREQAEDDSAWQGLLKRLQRFDPHSLADHDAGKAFWINVYNIAAIKAILDHYPVESIRSRSIHWLKQPWKKLGLVVGGEFYSLQRIEFDILVEKYRDLRIHFAINCASLSCPDLRPEPFVARELERQLTEQGERFVLQQSKGLQIDRQRGQVKVSQIFRFDREHFEAWAGGAVPFLLAFVRDNAVRDYLIQGEYELDYLDYDWAVNDLPR